MRSRWVLAAAAVTMFLSGCAYHHRAASPELDKMFVDRLREGGGVPFHDTPGLDEECDRQLTKLKGSKENGLLRILSDPEAHIDWEHVIGGGMTTVKYVILRGSGESAYLQMFFTDLQKGRWSCSFIVPKGLPQPPT